MDQTQNDSFPAIINTIICLLTLVVAVCLQLFTPATVAGGYVSFTNTLGSVLYPFSYINFLLVVYNITSASQFAFRRFLRIYTPVITVLTVALLLIGYGFACIDVCPTNYDQTHPIFTIALLCYSIIFIVLLFGDRGIMKNASIQSIEADPETIQQTHDSISVTPSMAKKTSSHHLFTLLLFIIGTVFIYLVTIIGGNKVDQERNVGEKQEREANRKAYKSYPVQTGTKITTITTITITPVTQASSKYHPLYIQLARGGGTVSLSGVVMNSKTIDTTITFSNTSSGVADFPLSSNAFYISTVGRTTAETDITVANGVVTPAPNLVDGQFLEIQSNHSTTISVSFPKTQLPATINYNQQIVGTINP